MCFVELRQELGLYSQVMVGMSIRNLSLFNDIRTPVSYDGHLRNLNQAWQDNMNTSLGKAGDQASLSSWHSDIGIPINFQEESGCGTF